MCHASHSGTRGQNDVMHVDMKLSEERDSLSENKHTEGSVSQGSVWWRNGNPIGHACIDWSGSQLLQCVVTMTCAFLGAWCNGRLFLVNSFWVNARWKISWEVYVCLYVAACFYVMFSLCVSRWWQRTRGARDSGGVCVCVCGLSVSERVLSKHHTSRADGGDCCISRPAGTLPLIQRQLWDPSRQARRGYMSICMSQVDVQPLLIRRSHWKHVVHTSMQHCWQITVTKVNVIFLHPQTSSGELNMDYWSVASLVAFSSQVWFFIYGHICFWTTDMG